MTVSLSLTVLWSELDPPSARPKSGYMLFSGEMRDKVKEARAVSVVKCGEMW